MHSRVRSFNETIELSSHVSNNEVFSFSSETPVSVFSNKCDTCGKSFAHISSYRRHTRNQCVPRSQKRRRKLWSCSPYSKVAENLFFLSQRPMIEEDNFL